jgi:hypothetical protein
MIQISQQIVIFFGALVRRSNIYFEQYGSLHALGLHPDIDQFQMVNDFNLILNFQLAY